MGPRMDQTEPEDFQTTSNLPWVLVQRCPKSRQDRLRRAAHTRPDLRLTTRMLIRAFARLGLHHDHEDRDQNDRSEQLKSEFLQHMLEGFLPVARDDGSHDGSSIRG